MEGKVPPEGYIAFAERPRILPVVKRRVVVPAFVTLFHVTHTGKLSHLRLLHSAFCLLNYRALVHFLADCGEKHRVLNLDERGPRARGLGFVRRERLEIIAAEPSRGIGRT